MSYRDYLGDAYSENTQEFNPERAQQQARQERGNLNIVLMGATGVGKSSLVNAVFGEDVVKAGDGEPITQYLEKIPLMDKGITLWDTKGIEAKNYEQTVKQLKEDINKGFQQAFDSNQPDKMPHIAWLCIKESSRRIQDSDVELIEIVKNFNIPTIIVFTDTMKAGDDFYKKACNQLKGEYNDFLKDRFVRVNSVKREIDEGMIQEPKGLESLLDITGTCLEDVSKVYQEVFIRAQQINIAKRKQAMIESAQKAVHIAAAAAATAGASPIPGSDAPIITAIQTKMIHSINGYFEVDMESSMATSAVMSILGVTAVAQVGKAIASNLLKLIPVAGSVVGGAVSAATALAITEAVGFAYIEVMKKYFDDKSGRVVLPENTAEWLAVFEAFFKK